ncbi:MAG: hypothetical protein VCC99_14400 [Alphaproteobacteria bacterium]
MRVWYEIDDDLSCTFVKRFGDYVHDEWMDAMRRINDDPRLRPGMSRIVDLREGGGSATQEKIAELARMFDEVDEALGQRKVAMIAPKSIDFGMNRMYGIMRDSSHATNMVFKTFEEAKDWLELSAEFADPFPRLDDLESIG